MSRPRREISPDANASPGPLRVDLSDVPSTHSPANRLLRCLWGAAWLVLFRPSPKPLHAWRRALLRLFGAEIGRGCHVHASVKIWAPWNLTMYEHSCLGPHVDCYCVAPVVLGPHSTVSQYSYLCTAAHDPDDPQMAFQAAPIELGEASWICADVYVAAGVTVGEGGVAGARSVVVKDVPAWTIVAGNPARPIRRRQIRRTRDAA
jgi:putative colanic acid biosynthesis acetyltransferase WcaF